MSRGEAARVGEHGQAGPVAGILASSLQIVSQPVPSSSELFLAATDDMSSKKRSGRLAERAGLNSLAESFDPPLPVDNHVDENPASAR